MQARGEESGGEGRDKHHEEESLSVMSVDMVLFPDLQINANAQV